MRSRANVLILFGFCTGRLRQQSSQCGSENGASSSPVATDPKGFAQGQWQCSKPGRFCIAALGGGILTGLV
jgi:hypothetical protein